MPELPFLNKRGWIFVMLALTILACDLPSLVTSALPSAANNPTRAPTGAVPTKPPGKLSDRVPPILVQLKPATATTPLSFSWTAVNGATNYTLVVAEANPYRVVWVWTGTKTQVAYGDLGIADDELTPDLVGWPITATQILKRAPTLEPGKSYVWSVMAMSGSRRLAVSIAQPMR